MRKPSYIVLYRDSPISKVRTFGPFVNQTIADEFKENLPTPLKGGYKIRRHTEPETYQQAKEVAAKLVAERDQQSLTHA